MPNAIKVLSADTIRALSSIQRQQFPFAFAKSLTQIAKTVQTGVQMRTRLEFQLHSEFIPRGIRIIPAKKGDVKTGRAFSAVYTAERISTFMPIHEEGGQREPSRQSGGGGGDKGASFALPGQFLQTKKFRTSTGKVKQRWRPAELLRNYRRHGSGGGKLVAVSRGGRKKTPFIIRGKGSGVPMIVRRKSKKRTPLEVLYIFSSRATIKPVWDFEETVEKVVQLGFSKKFSRNLALAVETAGGFGR